jgi:hypothetical protein
MRPSPLRHPVAILRQLLGLDQQAFANLTGRSRPTVKAVELCKLALSAKFAGDIADATGIDPAWLLAGDPLTPPRRLDAGGDYTHESFQRWLVAKLQKSPVPSTPIDADALASSEGRKYAEALTAILRAAIGAGATTRAIAAYRVEEFLRLMARDFGGADHLLGPATNLPNPVKYLTAGQAVSAVESVFETNFTSGPALREAQRASYMVTPHSPPGHTSQKIIVSIQASMAARPTPSHKKNSP